MRKKRFWLSLIIIGFVYPLFLFVLEVSIEAVEDLSSLSNYIPAFYYVFGWLVVVWPLFHISGILAGILVWKNHRRGLLPLIAIAFNVCFLLFLAFAYIYFFHGSNIRR